MNRGLYIHIPFCRTRCHFCAFYLKVYREQDAAGFIAALKREIALYAGMEAMQRRQFGSVYFGGGTPTTLSPTQLVDLLDTVRHRLPVASDAEVSLEAHPESVGSESLAILRRAGFNRLSLGVETLRQHELARVGRPGTVAESLTAVTAAKEAGFDNVNLDLMYGLPGQSIADWEATLNGVVSLDPAHLSCYALTVEQDTYFERRVASGLVEGPDPERQMEMELLAHDILGADGYTRYEISNYARPGFACRHNLLYWTDGEYLGLGPSAQSFLDGVRFGNIADLSGYVEAVASDTLPIENREPLSPEQRVREAVVFGLRLIHGIPATLVDSSTETGAWRHKLHHLLAERYLERADDRIRLTTLGRRYADTVAVELL
jgi:oxygen-independent coproporphyrinogen-3 oxidase